MTNDQKSSRALIKLYKSHRLLWDPHHMHYLNKKIRHRAWEDIGQSLNKCAAHVKKKMTSLLGSYRREKSRQKLSRSDGWKKEVYVSKWFAYDLFSFMRNKDNPDHNEDETVETIVPVEMGQDTTNNTTNTTETTNTNRTTNTTQTVDSTQPVDTSNDQKKRKYMQEDQDPLRSAPVPSFNIPIPRYSAGTSNDPYYIYGQHISNELRKYDPRTLAHVKNAINNIIFEADMGKYQDLVNGQYLHPNYMVATRSPPADAGFSVVRSSLTGQLSRDTDSSESDHDVKEVLIKHNFRV